VLDTAAETARYTNFEALTINNVAAVTATSSQDMALLSGIDTVTVIAQDDTASAADAVMTTALTNARATTTLNVHTLSTASTAANFTVATTVASAIDGAADTVNLVLGTATASSGADVTTVTDAKVLHDVTASDAETINVTSQGGANMVGTIDAADLTTLNVSGGKSFTMAALSNTTALATVDASGMTGTAALVMGTNASTTAGTYTGSAGADTITGSTKADTITGGAGIDTITGGAGGDTVHGGDGADAITAGTGADTLNGDAGDDVISFATANLTSLDTVDGGAGTDTLSMTNVSSIVDADFTNITNVEKVTQTDTTHNMTLVLGAASNASGLTTVTDGTGVTNVTVGALHTNALTVAVSTGDDVIDGSASAAELTVTVAAASIATGDVWTGGTGSDTLTITADGTAVDAGDFDGLTGFETITLATNVSTGAITLADVNIADGKSLTIDGTAITGSNKVLTVVGSNETNGSLTVKGGAGADVITGTASDLGDNLQGNAGNDTFNFATANFTSADTVDGGAGTADVINVTGTAVVVDADFTLVTNVEKLTAGALTLTLGDVAQAAAVNTIAATGALTLTLDADYTSDLSLALVANADTVTGTAYTGDLAITYAADNLTTDDTLIGGTGTNDSITVSGAGAVALEGTDLTNVSNFEKIIFGSDAGAASATLVQGNVAAGKALTVDATALVSTNALTFIGSAETNGGVTVLGGAGDDHITGTASSVGDTLNGGRGADTFTFAVANLTSIDTIVGGSGTDIVTFSDAGTISDVDLTNLTSVETLTTVTNTGTSVVTLGAAAAAAGIVTVNASSTSTTLRLEQIIRMLQR